MRHKVLVTGLGIISPVGNNLQDCWANLMNGNSGIDTITKFDASDYKIRIAGEVKGFQPAKAVPTKEIRRMELFIQYAVTATEQALKDANLEITEQNANDAGVSIGVGIGGLQFIEKSRDALVNHGPNRISPFFIPMTISNMASGYVSILFGTKGYSSTTTSACSSSNHSIGDASRMIERGDADIMIVGGSESTICPLAIGGFGAMRALSTRNNSTASRPYDVTRDGFVLGEGCGILILESEAHAKKRGAKVYAELSGYGYSSDAFHITAPSLEGPKRAMLNALKDAEITTVDYINTHGTSTPIGDINELKAIIQALGLDAAKKAHLSSTKSMTGHLLGGAGGIEAVFTLLAMQNSYIPPTINVEQLDPECQLNITPNQPAPRVINSAMSNSFGFGGTNATLVFKKYE